jgi:hypothetical protein
MPATAFIRPTVDWTAWRCSFPHQLRVAYSILRLPERRTKICSGLETAYLISRDRFPPEGANDLHAGGRNNDAAAEPKNGV